MLKIYKTTQVEKKVKKAKTISADSWIDMISPTQEEIEKVLAMTNIDEDLIIKMLDDEERPRIDVTENATLVVIDTPYLETNDKDHFVYNTSPLGIIITDNNYVITISPNGTKVLSNFKKNKIKDFRTAKKTRFLIQILIETATEYIKALKKVNQRIEIKEKELTKATSNKELIEMLDLEKTLVYFLTSLKANDLVLDKLKKGNILPLYEGDSDLLDDAIVENKQAIEQSEIQRNILESITDTYASIVNNNLNEVMKFLAGITIVISIPTMISSFLGMNVPFGDIGENPTSAIIIFFVSLILAIIIAIILKKKNLL